MQGWQDGRGRQRCSWRRGPATAIVQKIEREALRILLLQARVVFTPALLPAPHNHSDAVLHSREDGIHDADRRAVALVAVARQHHNALPVIVHDGAVPVNK